MFLPAGREDFAVQPIEYIKLYELHYFTIPNFIALPEKTQVSLLRLRLISSTSAISLTGAAWWIQALLTRPARSITTARRACATASLWILGPKNPKLHQLETRGLRQRYCTTKETLLENYWESWFCQANFKTVGLMRYREIIKKALINPLLSAKYTYSIQEIRLKR